MISSFESRRVTVGSNSAHYWKEGDQGDALVLLHGVSCSVLEFEHNVNYLSRRYQVYALDLLGHGYTDKPLDETYTVERQSQFVLDFMSTVGLEKAHLLGWSLGGRLALQCAAMQPERVLSMILVAPGGVDDNGGFILDLRLMTLPVLGDMLARLKPSAVIYRNIWNKNFFVNPELFVTNDFVQKKLEIGSLPGAGNAVLKTLRSLANIWGFTSPQVHDIQSKMPDMTMPVLVIWGQQDRIISSDHHRVLAERLPNVQVELLDKCGHAPHMEQNAAFNEKVLSFLNDTIAKKPRPEEPELQKE